MPIQVCSRHGNPANPIVGMITVDAGDVFVMPTTGTLLTVASVAAAVGGAPATVTFTTGQVLPAGCLEPFFRASYRGTGQSDPQWPTPP